ncbi:PD-(D/E)XK nuclease family protein [Jiulongibacter sp. NS-SX5]|uniref:PD-(D/E)XK nuclease family protein n=1 Tax=Jiulongibacter sp. NS-SX5 TaxID=3463854 RepID=UPI00405A1C1C
MRFLQKSAIEIFKNHSLQDLRDVCVILPSRRSTFFFKKELSELSEKPFVSPHVFAIDDFVTELSELQISDQVSLIFDLFHLYKKHDPEVSFEEFITWGSTILKDFDLIDQYLVPDVKGLYSYMSEAEALSRWDVSADAEFSFSSGSKAYFSFFETIGKVYFELKQQLQSSGKSYKGMAYRNVAEGFDQVLSEDLPYLHYYFVGLNALSLSEEKIITKLVKSQKGTCFWDTDAWFMDSKHQAGDVLRRYRNSGIFGSWNKPENLLATDDKVINVYNSPFETLQSKIGADQFEGGSTVFVVPDENLIQPLLFSLGSDVEDYNITMGLGMGQSKIAVLMNNHFALQTEGNFTDQSSAKYNHRYLLRILNNPLIQLYELYKYPIEKPYQTLAQTIKTKNLVYISQEELLSKVNNDELFQLLFTHTDGKPLELVQNQRAILELLQSTIAPELDGMEKEFFVLYFSILNRLSDELKEHSDLTLDGLMALMKELIKQQRVPFTGEPVANLQIMSLLETRCLDFEHVVLYSFNEGVVPSSQKNNSMIPFEACLEYGIPVFSDQDSIMAYHFFRLMMRAKKVDIIYASSGTTGVGGAKEKSRFVLQLLNNLAPVNKGLKITEHDLDFVNSSDNQDEIVVEKTPELIEKIKKYLETKGISASALNQYYNCPLDFYFSKILRVGEQEEVEEVFGSNVFGNWIHYSIEKIAKEIILEKNLIDEQLKPRVLSAIPKVLDEVFKKNFSGYQADRGVNYIYREMAKKLLHQYYEHQVFKGQDKMIIASELGLFHVFELQGLKVKLNGNIDSVEMHDGQLHLIDFKTGKVEPAQLKTKGQQSIEESFREADKDKFRQLLIYKYLTLKELQKSGKLNKYTLNKSQQVYAGMISFRDLKTYRHQEDYSALELESGVENALDHFISEILNPNIPFEHSTKTKYDCKFCSMIL